MFQGNNPAEEFIFLIYAAKKFFILTIAETKTNIGFDSKTDLFPDAFNDKIKYRICQLLTIIIIIIYFLSVAANGSKSKWADRVDIKSTVKRLNSAIRIHHFIN